MGVPDDVKTLHEMGLTTRFPWILAAQSAMRTEFAAAAAGTFVLSIASRLLYLLASILLARWLGALEFGIYASAIAMLLLLSVLAQFGIPTLVIRLLPFYESRREWGLMRGLIRWANATVLPSSLFVASVGAIVIWSLGDQLEVVSTRTLLWTMAILPVAALASLRSAMLRGFRHVVVGQLPESLIVPTLFVIAIVIWRFFTLHDVATQLSSDIAVALRLAVTIIAFSVGAWLMVKKKPAELLLVAPEYDRLAWMQSAAPLLFLAGMTIVNTQTDVLMLAAIQGAESAGVYQAAARGGELVALPLFVISAVVQPTISRLYACGKLQHLQRVITASTLTAFVLALPIAAILALFAVPILVVVYGLEFERGATSLTILCAAQLVNVGVGLVGQILIMTGHERDAAIGVGTGAIINVLLNAILIPVWDIEGAALATGVSLVVWNIFLTSKVRLRTNLYSSVLLPGWVSRLR